MTFVGRTNWNGILKVEPTEDPLRLLYVKNGGAILARLPLVPGLYSQVVADLSGDDIRLQAEAYIRVLRIPQLILWPFVNFLKQEFYCGLNKGKWKRPVIF